MGCKDTKGSIKPIRLHRYSDSLVEHTSNLHQTTYDIEVPIGCPFSWREYSVLVVYTPFTSHIASLIRISRRVPVFSLGSVEYSKHSRHHTLMHFSLACSRRSCISLGRVNFPHSFLFFCLGFVFPC